MTESLLPADDLRHFLEHLAKASAEVICPWFFNTDLKIEFKADATPVTEADTSAEQRLRECIRERFPDHGIIGEEYPEENPGAPFNWVLDPIDGTKAFAAGSPHFGTLICLREGEQPIWSAIHLPVLNRLYIGNTTEAWLNGSSLRMPPPPSLDKCLLLCTDAKDPSEGHSKAGWQRLLHSTGDCRSWGDCFGYTLLASGTAHIMTDPILSIWDLAALIPVITGAGGTLSAWDGSPAATASSCVAAHPQIHSKVIDILNS
jgi:histidinol phosphatase-like enzyme (inositol monophosphatase family)